MSGGAKARGSLGGGGGGGGGGGVICPYKGAQPFTKKKSSGSILHVVTGTPSVSLLNEIL